MLVVSRKKNETLHFANLGITVEILRIAGNTVRVGVDAPKEVRIRRGELADEPDAHQPSDQPSPELARQERHDLRNRLNSANLALHLMQKQLDAGRVEDADDTLASALNTLSELDYLANGGSSEGPSKSGGGGGRRALVVEDSPNERELLAGYLRLCGYEVDVVADGLAAMMYLAKNERPDVVLLDMEMPRMNGKKTVSAIRCNAAYKGLKVFAVSGADKQQIDLPRGNRGVDGWFPKPLNPTQFVEELKRALEPACA